MKHISFPNLKVHYKEGADAVCGLWFPVPYWYNWSTLFEDITCKRCQKWLEREQGISFEKEGETVK